MTWFQMNYDGELRAALINPWDRRIAALWPFLSSVRGCGRMMHPILDDVRLSAIVAGRVKQ